MKIIVIINDLNQQNLRLFKLIFFMYKNVLKKVEFFKLLSEEEIELVSNSCKIITLNKDNILFYEGDFANSFYIMLQGKLKLYKTGTMGNEIVIHNFSKPTILAEMATFQASPFPATAISTSSITKVAILEKEVFLSLLQSNANLSFHIIGSLIKKMRNLEQTIHRNLVYDATQKVCAFLRDNPNILIERKHSEIANKLNMAPATLSRSIKKIKEKGYINKENIVVDNSFYEILE
ncbi:Crp/Fnr family transcriptional regulator [Halarcobacter sp.]|uniref:Crp/Fnr family transcriptional regulator n=1 Tax=Halarcobacter sp. TaxID=2321133 RepID=UPI003A954068